MTNHNSDPKFARESFTWRRMRTWQVTAIAVAVIVLVGLYFGLS